METIEEYLRKCDVVTRISRHLYTDSVTQNIVSMKVLYNVKANGDEEKGDSFIRYHALSWAAWEARLLHKNDLADIYDKAFMKLYNRLFSKK